MKITLTPRQVLHFIILGIKNKQYQASINIAQDCIDQMDKEVTKDDNRTNIKKVEEGSA